MPLLNPVTFMLMGMALGSSMAVAMTLLYKMVVKRAWPIQAPIAMQRGKSVVWHLGERAKQKTNKRGYEMLRLRKRKKNIKPPKYDRLSVNTKGKPVYPLFNTVKGQFFPVKIMNPPRLEVVEDKSAKNWAVGELQRLTSVYAPKESAWLRLAPYFMNAAFAAMVIFFVIYFGGKMEIVSSSLSGAANALTNAVNTMKLTPPP